MPELPLIIHNELITPDGTHLVSHHRHDYITHTDTNGKVYMLDGGHSYCRSSSHADQTHILLTTDDPHELVREHLLWGTYGPAGDKPLSYIKLKDMETDHIEKILKNLKWEPSEPYYKFFVAELAFR